MDAKLLQVVETRQPFSPEIDATYYKSGILRERIKRPEEFCMLENMLIFCLLLLFIQYDFCNSQTFPSLDVFPQLG